MWSSRNRLLFQFHKNKNYPAKNDLTGYLGIAGAEFARQSLFGGENPAPRFETF